MRRKADGRTADSLEGPRSQPPSFGWHYLPSRCNSSNVRPCTSQSDPISWKRTRPPAAEGRPADSLGLLAQIGWHYLSSATCLMRPRVFYGITCLIRLIELAASFAAFEGHMCYTSSVRQVVPP